MSTTANTTMSPVTLQGALYTRRTLKSPMAQLTCLKTVTTATQEPESVPTETKPLGIPGRPGTGALDEKPPRPPLRRQATVVRPDLGCVPSVRQRAAEGSSLGTVSNLLFGRKGGLL